MVTEAEAGSPAESDWQLAQDNLLAEPSRWGTLSWISAKALIDSINHGLDRFSDGLVPQLRQHWVQRVPGPPLRIIERPDDTTFMIIGDTGEQDASQYVVCPSLSAAVRAHEPGFVMIASDVIYPAGDVDDYRDGVYRPYRSPDPHFSVAAPLLGLPGNHDWYDGLSGFMYHFANQDLLPAEAYTPPRITPRSVLGRLFRILWRRARTAAQRDRAAARRRADRLGESAHPHAGAAGAVLRRPDQAPAAGRHRHRHRRPPRSRAVGLADRGLAAARAEGAGDREAAAGQRQAAAVLGRARSRRTASGTRSGSWSTGRSTSTWPRSAATCTTSRSTCPMRRPARSCIWSLGVAGRSCTRPTRTRMPTSTPGPATTPPAASTPCPRSPSPPVTSRSGTSPGCWCPVWSG